ncbi:MAG: hypothetical protein ROZ37_19225 [Aromatoleum sp.]|jgi:hypothetical protein|uniref:hypothetical protein n=1 Tax=Aromatoleum sp. TaxID=2307007 RepID=UPI002893F913|nr:hypothetical protein [Aromatoleum sp.]MDT3672458.1 hypothetical protein [Aromatoleum sp.]
MTAVANLSPLPDGRRHADGPTSAYHRQKRLSSGDDNARSRHPEIRGLAYENNDRQPAPFDRSDTPADRRTAGVG